MAALRECDLLCCVLAVQDHAVLNTPFLKFALVQHTLTVLLPMPRPHGSADVHSCIWRTPMLYDQQLGTLLLLQPVDVADEQLVPLDTPPRAELALRRMLGRGGGLG